MMRAAGARTFRAPVRLIVLARVAAAAALGFAAASCARLPFADAPPAGPVARVVVDAAQARQVISDYRRAHGAADVSLDPVLVRVAQRQADAMAGADQLSHTVDGSLPERLAAGGAERAAAVENVSAGYDSLGSAIAGWRRSPAHNANLLFGPMRRMGIAAARAPTTRFKTFWALVMTN